MEEFLLVMLPQSLLLSWLACRPEESLTSPRSFKGIFLGSSMILASSMSETEDV